MTPTKLGEPGAEASVVRYGVMSSDQIFAGLALTIGLAVGSQLLASKLRLPAIIVLLPVGFTAGALTSNINPNNLFGATFQPLVGLAIAIVLFDAGLGLDLSRMDSRSHRVVRRLILVGISLTWAVAAAVSVPLFGMSSEAAVMLGVILVVSGPTVVGSLMNFVRPERRVQNALTWESSLVDPIGAVLGALVFQALTVSSHHRFGYEVGQYLASLAIGIAGGLVGIAVMWFVVRVLRVSQILVASAVVATVVTVAAVCDIVRADTGLVAAIVMGAAFANLPRVDLPEHRPFFDVVVQLIIGLLFISISATVTPASVRHVIWPSLGLIAVLVLLVRPAVALVSTIGAHMSWPERAFVGWLYPRGIIAASTASAFTAGLVAAHVKGASDILPVTFLVIVGTVTVYGLTAVPVARLLHVMSSSASRPLLVGGSPWVIDLGRALSRAGVSTVMWAAEQPQRQAIEEAGLELAPGDLLANVTGMGAALEEITSVLLLSGQEEFNVLASSTLSGVVPEEVYRLPTSFDVVTPVASTRGDKVLFGRGLTSAEIARRFGAGQRFVVEAVDGGGGPAAEFLFVVQPEGRLVPVTTRDRPRPHLGDAVVLLAEPVAG